MIFLVLFSRKNGLQRVVEYADSEIAAANLDHEQAIRSNLANLGDVEIALFDAVDFDTLKSTHSRYFSSLAQITDSMKAELSK